MSDLIILGVLFGVAYAGIVWSAWRIGWANLEDDTTEHEPLPDPRPALGRAVQRAQNLPSRDDQIESELQRIIDVEHRLDDAYWEMIGRKAEEEE